MAASEPSRPEAGPAGDEPAWLGKLSHDLRNQLAPMRTASQMLLAGRLDAAQQKEMLELLDRQVQRMVRMCDDLAEYGRLRGGRVAARTERLDLGILVDTALGEAGRRIQAAGQTLRVQLPEQRLPLDGDRERLVRVFLRLLDNAVRFTPREGRIDVEVALDHAFAEVRVRDDGAGIDPARLGTLFALPDALRASDGLGISLLLSRLCVEQHGGSLEAHSAGAGRGSEFVVRLPLASAPAQPSSASQRA